MEAILSSTCAAPAAKTCRPHLNVAKSARNLACALGAAAVVLTSAGLYQGSAEALASARAELAVAQGSLAGQREALSQVLSATPEGKAKEAAAAWLADTPAEVPAEVSADSLIAMGTATETCQDAREEALGLAQEAYVLKATCLGAQKQDALDTAREEAAGPLAEAEAVAAGEDYGLASKETRSRLEAATCLVRLMGRTDTFWDASQVEGATVDLKEATEAAKAEVAEAQAKREAEAAAARAAASASKGSGAYGNSFASKGAAAAAAPAGASTYQSSDGAWHINYSNAYGTGSAASDGSVTKWADGYYIAHNWSDNGAKITGRTEYVEVDGKTYRLAGSQEVSRDTTWEEVEGWVHANGGIGMQTCVEGGGYLINHYEPVN